MEPYPYILAYNESFRFVRTDEDRIVCESAGRDAMNRVCWVHYHTWLKGKNPKFGLEPMDLLFDLVTK